MIILELILNMLYYIQCSVDMMDMMWSNVKKYCIQSNYARIMILFKNKQDTKSYSHAAAMGMEKLVTL